MPDSVITDAGDFVPTNFNPSNLLPTTSSLPPLYDAASHNNVTSPGLSGFFKSSLVEIETETPPATEYDPEQAVNDFLVAAVTKLKHHPSATPTHRPTTPTLSPAAPTFQPSQRQDRPTNITTKPQLSLTHDAVVPEHS